MALKSLDKVRKLAKSAQQLLYDGRCTIYEYQKVIDPLNHETISDEVPVYTDLPCRLSFKNFPAATDSQTADTLSQEIKLFLDSGITIKAGSKVVVTQNGITNTYKNSGQAAVYATHQEVILSLYEEHP